MTVAAPASQAFVDVLLAVDPRPPFSLVPCRRSLYADGVLVVAIGGPPARVVDRWVQEVGLVSCCEVDWHYGAGWANVLCWSRDVLAVRRAVDVLLPDLREAERRADRYQLGDAAGGISWRFPTS